MTLVPTTEMWLGGAWVEVTDRVRYESGVTITRQRAGTTGRGALQPGTMDLELDTTDGAFSLRNPVGEYYGLLSRNTRIRQRAHDLDSYAWLTGEQGSNLTTPDAAALDITGDIDVRVDIHPATWRAPGIGYLLMSKALTTGDQRSWYLGLSEDGTVLFGWSSAGTSATWITRESTSAIAADTGRLALRATLDVNNGAAGHTVTFYTADNIDGAWTQLGSPVVTAGTTSIFSSTAVVEIGSGNSSNVIFIDQYRFQGRVYAAEIRDGIGGTVVADPDLRAQEPYRSGDETTFDDSSRTWTIQELADVRNDGYRFVGEIAAFPPSWADESGNLVWTKIQASGITRRLTQGDEVLRSPLFRQLSGQSPTGYWPLEDGSGSTSAASAVAANRAAIVKGVTFSAEDTLPGSATCVQVESDDSAVSGVVRPLLSGSDTGFSFMFLFKLNGLPASKRQIMEVRTSGTVARWTFYSSATAFFAEGYSDDDVLIASCSGAHTVDPVNNWVAMQLETEDVGADVDVAFIWVEVGNSEVDTTFYAVTDSYTGSTGSVRSFSGGGAGSMRLAHIWAGPNTLPFVTWNFINAVNGWTGEGAVERMTRLCDEEGVEFAVDTWAGWEDGQLMGRQRTDTLTNLITECETIDGGVLYEPRDVFGLAYRPRTVLYEATGPTLDWGERHIYAPFEPVDDDQTLRNRVTVTRPDGSSATAQLDAGNLSTLDPPDGVGVYATEFSVNAYSDDQLVDLAGWDLLLGTWDEMRFPRLDLHLGSPTYTEDALLLANVAQLDIGHMFFLGGLPPTLPPGEPVELIRGTTERISDHEWNVSLLSTPGGPYTHVATLAEDDGEARTDFDAATLNSSMTTTGTSLSLAVESGYPLATTDSGEMPYDIVVGGEVMTVTAASGSSSPQTLTVTRSVNGVVKAHDAGAEVRLAEPTYAAL